MYACALKASTLSAKYAALKVDGTTKVLRKRLMHGTAAPLLVRENRNEILLAQVEMGKRPDAPQRRLFPTRLLPEMWQSKDQMDALSDRSLATDTRD
jgi:hypothetical protein